MVFYKIGIRKGQKRSPLLDMGLGFSSLDSFLSTKLSRKSAERLDCFERSVAISSFFHQLPSYGIVFLSSWLIQSLLSRKD